MPSCEPDAGSTDGARDAGDAQEPVFDVGLVDADLPCLEQADLVGTDFPLDLDAGVAPLGWSHKAMIDRDNNIMIEDPKEASSSGKAIAFISLSASRKHRMPNCSGEEFIDFPRLVDGSIYYINYEPRIDAILLYSVDLSALGTKTYDVRGVQRYYVFPNLGIWYQLQENYFDNGGTLHTWVKNYFQKGGNGGIREVQMDYYVDCHNEIDRKVCDHYAFSYGDSANEFFVYSLEYRNDPQRTCYYRLDPTVGGADEIYCSNYILPSSNTYGYLAVNEDARNTAEFGVTEYDLYMVNVKTKEVTEITHDKGSQTCPKIFGNVIVYQDSTEFGGSEGMGYLWAYDISTKIKRKFPLEAKSGCPVSMNSRYLLFSEGFGAAGTFHYLIDMEKLGVVKDGGVVAEQ